MVEEWQIGGKVRRLVGPRCLAVDRRRRRPVARLAQHHGRSARAAGSPQRPRRRNQGGRIQARSPARHGRLQPVPRSAREILREHRGFPEMHVLDSTDPAQVKTFENKIDLANTIFIVSSKSGSTLEPNIFKQYFFDRVPQTIGADKAGEPIHRRHRPRLENGAGRHRRPFPPHLPRRRRASAAAIPRSPISAWCPPPSWASTRPSFSIAPT